LAAVFNDLAEVYSSESRYKEAELSFLRALAIYEKNLGPEHPNVATVLHNLATTQLEAGRYVAAEQNLRRALASRKAVWAGRPGLSAPSKHSRGRATHGAQIRRS